MKKNKNKTKKTNIEYYVCRICRLMFHKNDEIDHHILVVKHLEWEYFEYE